MTFSILFRSPSPPKPSLRDRLLIAALKIGIAAVLLGFVWLFLLPRL